uniref:Uncharacterized protein n=1 Tax=Euplotes harpa TaxID=151035 RepID=A0A7S3J7V2_9SPIT|mmetsp:Transcript_24503/g.28181  ORF Transcript_24503/g.28181 Transcript_24503/m.28181 type:complete len:143 (+) Transcript_24503:1680-2108(+)
MKEENFIEIKPKRNKKYLKEVSGNDEIKTLKKIFYDLFNDENSDQKIDSTHVLTNYDYPVNIYYNSDVKNLLKENMEEEKLDKRETASNFESVSMESYKINDDDKENDDDHIEKSKNILKITPPIQLPIELLIEKLKERNQN